MARRDLLLFLNIRNNVKLAITTRVMVKNRIVFDFMVYNITG